MYQLGHESDHSPSSSAEVKNEWSCTSMSPYVYMAWCLIKQLLHLHRLILSSAQGQLYLLPLPCGIFRATMYHAWCMSLVLITTVTYWIILFTL